MTQNFADKIPKYAMTTGIAVTLVGAIPIIGGFGLAGITAGSVAAAVQSMIGNVAAGSVFALCTSLGMTGAFVGTTAVGTIVGTGGFIAYLKNRFSAEKDSKLISTIIREGDNPELIIKLLESRFPQQREEIRRYFNNMPGNRNFDVEILNFIPINLRVHVINLLRNTNAIYDFTQPVRLLLRRKPFENYFINDFNEINDANLIYSVINNNDNPLIIIRLLNYRDESQRKKIDKEFREIVGNKDLKLLQHIRNFMPEDPELIYLFELLNF